MGLAERRAAKEYQDTTYPKFTTEMKRFLSDKATVDVKWDELAEDGQSHLYKSTWDEIYFKPIVEAMRQITRDDLGKEAVKASIKTITIRNSKGASSPSAAMSFESGDLVVDHALSNVGDTGDRIEHLVELIEKGL